MLSVVIVFVFSSLLVLVYLTLRSYRALTQLRPEDYLDDQLHKESRTCRDEIRKEVMPDIHINNNQSETLMKEFDGLNIAHPHCSCHLEHNHVTNEALRMTTHSQDVICGEGGAYFSDPVDDCAKINYDIDYMVDQTTFYDVHSDRADYNYQLNPSRAPVSMISELPSGNKSVCSYSLYHYRISPQDPTEPNSNYCESPIDEKTLTVGGLFENHSRVNMVENPLNSS